MGGQGKKRDGRENKESDNRRNKKTSKEGKIGKEREIVKLRVRKGRKEKKWEQERRGRAT